MRPGEGVDRDGGRSGAGAEQGNVRLIERVGHYGRVSSDLQAERGTIEAQRDYLQRQAEREGYAPVIEEWDAGWSGTIPFHERPGGRRITDAAEARRLDTLYVYAWDRLGRDAAEGIAVARYLESLGVDVVSATQGRADTAAGRFQRNIHLVVAEYGRENILEVTRSGKLRAARQGKWCGRVPYGWTVKDGILVHRDVEVLPGMSEAEVMRDILFRLADTETSLVGEARRLNTLAVPAVIRYCKGDGTETITWTGPWTEARLSRMVKNPIHKGEHIHKSRPGGRNRPVQTEIPQSFEPLVDASTWERANARLAANR